MRVLTITAGDGGTPAPTDSGPAGGGGGELPTTGANTLAYGLAATLLLVVGAGLTLAGTLRRRRVSP